MLRRSKRVKAVHPPQAVAPATSRTTSNSSTNTSIRIRKGSLQALPNLAVELQLQVFGELHPKDLLNLSRTCKTFRKFFLDRYNERLWQAVMANAPDLPTRPPFISIPAFIHLLYSPNCHNCGAANVRQILWPWFTRYCSKCLKQLACGRREVVEKLSTTRRFRRPFDIGDFGSLYRKLFDVLAQDGRYMDSQAYNRIRTQQVEEVLKEFKEVRKANRNANDPWGILAKRRHQEILERSKYVAECAKWDQQQQAARIQEIKKERLNAILQRLRDTGHEAEVEIASSEPGYFGELERVLETIRFGQATGLTENGWARVRPAIDGWLASMRQKIAARERNTILDNRLNELEEAIIAFYVQLPRTLAMEFRPCAGDLAYEPECEALGLAPNEQNITREDFAAILPVVAPRWLENVKNRLTKTVRRYVQHVPDGVELFDLAIVTFAWFGKGKSPKKSPLRFPDILAYKCVRDISLVDPLRNIPWHFNPWRFPANIRTFRAREFIDTPKCLNIEHTIRYMRKIVAALGLDPERATITELQACPGRLRCLKCAKPGIKDWVFGWEAALFHTHVFVQKHKATHDHWEAVKEQDLERVHLIEAQEHAVSLNTEHVAWSCSLCTQWYGMTAQVRQHLNDEHGIADGDNAVADGTVYVCPSQTEVFIKRPIILPAQPSQQAQVLDATNVAQHEQS